MSMKMIFKKYLSNTINYIIKHKKIVNSVAPICAIITLIVAILTLYLQNIEASVDATVIKYEIKASYCMAGN